MTKECQTCGTVFGAEGHACQGLRPFDVVNYLVSELDCSLFLAEFEAGATKAEAIAAINDVLRAQVKTSPEFQERVAAFVKATMARSN